MIALMKTSKKAVLKFIEKTGSRESYVHMV
jgi:hypothetical protein